jgi:hypothetical protein
LFEEDKKDKLFEKLSNFTLKDNIKTFNCEDAMLVQKNLEAITKTSMLQNLTYLKLPKNNLGNNGVLFIFSQDRLRHIKRLDLSSNNITFDGAVLIANSENFPLLISLDLRVNKIGDKGFKALVLS